MKLALKIAVLVSLERAVILFPAQYAHVGKTTARTLGTASSLRMIKPEACRRMLLMIRSKPIGKVHVIRLPQRLLLLQVRITELQYFLVELG